jgi:hypothetical protein
MSPPMRLVLTHIAAVVTLAGAALVGASLQKVG